MPSDAIFFPLSPLLRGRDERSSLLEGWGEGLAPRIRTRGESPSPAALVRVGLSPQAGRGGQCVRPEPGENNA
jgi:hypothetical protein